MSRMPNMMFVLKKINGKNNTTTIFEHMCEDAFQKGMCDQPKAERKENSLRAIKTTAKGNGGEP